MASPYVYNKDLRNENIWNLESRVTATFMHAEACIWLYTFCAFCKHFVTLTLDLGLQIEMTSDTYYGRRGGGANIIKWIFGELSLL